MTQASTAPKVLQAISSVMSDLAVSGIAKGRRNQQQGYDFRGIDEVYNALAPILSRHALIITPRCKSRQCEERVSGNNKPLFYVTVEMEYELASALDGSTVIASTFGEAMDSADKATNKAQSAAYKYMAMQQFCIPTEGMDDADAATSEVAPKASANDQRKPDPKKDGPEAPEGERSLVFKEAERRLWKSAGESATVFKTWWEENKASLKETLGGGEYAALVKVMKGIAADLKPVKEEDPFTDAVGPLCAQIDACASRVACDNWAENNKAELKALHDDDYKKVLAHWKGRMEALRPKAA